MRTAYRSQGIRRTLPLERHRGGSQEKTASSSVGEHNETADSEYCRSPQPPRRKRTPASILAKRHPRLLRPPRAASADPHRECRYESTGPLSDTSSLHGPATTRTSATTLS